MLQTCCSRCGPCDKNLKELPICAKKKGEGKVGSFQNCKHLVLKPLDNDAEDTEVEDDQFYDEEKREEEE